MPVINKNKYGQSKAASKNDANKFSRTTFNSEPVEELGENRKSRIKIEPVEPKFYNENSTAVNQFIDSVDFEGSTFNQTAKLFEFNQGFKNSEPTILFSSDFSSLYSNSKKNDTGNALQLKHDSKILNMKTALEVFLQTSGFNDEILGRKKDLDNFVTKQNQALHEILRSKNEAIVALDISTYKEQIKKEDNTIQTVSFLNFLNSNGYLNASTQFSNTKIWQQTLLELKKALLTHSLNVLGVQPTNIDDNDAWALYGINTENSTTKRVRIWFNPYISMPSVKDFTLPNDNSLISKKIESFIGLVTNLDKTQYLDLTANAGAPVNNPTNPNDKSTTQLASGDLSEFAKKIQSNNILENYSNSGRDISVVANMFFKELIYSSALISKINDLSLGVDYGYTLSAAGDNFVVWDHIIGRFHPDVRNMTKTPTGNGNSLVSLSQKAENDYQILTFERGRDVSSNKNYTPGNLFYVESSLNALETNEGDFTRLDQIISSTKNSINTFDRIYKILGYSPKDGNYVREENFLSSYTLDGLTKKLSIVSKIYKSCLVSDIQDTQKSYFSNALDQTKLNNLSDFDSVGIRLAAVICKTALNVRNQTLASFKVSGMEYQKVKDLKFLLFMWLMNAVLFRIEGTPDAGMSMGILRDNISSILSTKVKAGADITDGEIRKANDEGRTFPFKSGTSTSSNKSQVLQNVNNYYTDPSSTSHDRIFQIDADQGLWKIMVDTLVDVYKSPIYTTGTGRNGDAFTTYSGVSKSAYMYAYFDLMLRIIAAQTPESISAIYEVVYNLADELPAIATSRQAQSVTVNATKVKESGLLLTSVNRASIANYYPLDSLLDTNAVVYSTKLKNAINSVKNEENFLFSLLKLCTNFVKNLNYKLVDFRNVTSKNLSEYVKNSFIFFSQESLLISDPMQRAALFNLSLSQEQILMNQFILDEYKDKLNANSDTESKLRKINPEFEKFPEGFSNFLNVNDIEIASYDLFSSYFRSKEFENAKSVNKKIMSIGFPPKLISSLRDSSTPNNLIDKVFQNIIRVRIFKIDRLSPTIIYKPQQYLFEMNRFPTKMLINWDIETITADDANILRMPTKLFDFDKNNFIVCKNFLEAFPDAIYKIAGNSILNEEEQLLLYSNHIKSFLLEEYLRWLTETKFEESRYYRYSSISNDLSLIKNQYNTYLNYLGRTITTATSTTGTATAPVVAIFVDPTSKNEYKIPISAPQINSIVTSNQKNDQVKSVSNKKFNLNLDNTMMTYFQNETLLSDEKSELKKRATLPKKFDRVFNILFDPDDFEVDAAYAKTDIDKAEAAGILQKTSTGIYKHRDTSPGDVTFDEYFVTVEPYDYKI